MGGGIIGLATARELAMRHHGLRLAVVEKEKELGEQWDLWGRGRE